MNSDRGAQRPSNIEEALRRAEIVRRYVDLDRPSAEDDDRFAAELGFSRDKLYRLAKAWRLHGDPELLVGRGRKPSEADRLAARDAAQNPDLTSVNPTRRPLIRQRLEVLRSFLDIAQPTRSDEASAAASLNMNLDAFRRLARSWLLTRNAAALPGGSTPHKVPKRRVPALSAAVEQVISEAIAQLEPDARSTEVHRIVAAKCDAAALRVPPASTVYYRFVEARKALMDTSQELVAVDHAALELPVIGPSGVQLAVLSVVIERPSDHILVHALSLAPPSARSTAHLLTQSLRAVPEDGRLVPLGVGLPKGADWDRLGTVLEHAGTEMHLGPTRSLRPGHFLTRAFGTSIGRLKLRPRIATRPADAPIKPMGRGSMPLAFDEACEVVSGVIRELNASNPATGLRWVRPEQIAQIAADLGDLAL